MANRRLFGAPKIGGAESMGRVGILKIWCEHRPQGGGKDSDFFAGLSSSKSTWANNPYEDHENPKHHEHHGFVSQKPISMNHHASRETTRHLGGLQKRRTIFQSDCGRGSRYGRRMSTPRFLLYFSIKEVDLTQEFLCIASKTVLHFV